MASWWLLASSEWEAETALRWELKLEPGMGLPWELKLEVGPEWTGESPRTIVVDVWPLTS